jgi:predicted phosphate transport protein (TIGR00153 family)
MRLIPREEKYFALLAQMASKVREGGDLFVKIFRDFDNHSAYADQIKVVEVECDDLAAKIIKKLNSTFITPIDREDIYLLTAELDDVIDMINDLARRITIYDLTLLRSDAGELAGLLGMAAAELETAFNLLEQHEELETSLQKVGQIEKRADSLYSDAVQRLFKQEKNAIEVIKWMSIYENLENSVDRCKDVAEALEAVMVKNK